MKKIIAQAVVIILACMSYGYADTITYTEPLWVNALSDEVSYKIENRDTRDVYNLEFYSSEFMGFIDPEVYSGYYLGTIILPVGQCKGNAASGDNEFAQAVHDYLIALNNINIAIDQTNIYKAEEDRFNKDANEWYSEDRLLKVVLNSDGKSGTWSFVNTDQAFGFYAIKAAKEMALYFVWEPQNSGKWSTQYLSNPGGQTPSISHLTGIDPPISIVPEPGTMLLLGFGLLGLGLFARGSRSS